MQLQIESELALSNSLCIQLIDVHSFHIHVGAMAENGSGEETKVQFSDGLYFVCLCVRKGETVELV